MRAAKDIKIIKKKIPSFERLLEEQGGFGRFQLFAYITSVLGINCYGYLLYDQSFLLLYPDYICSELTNGVWTHIDTNNNHCKPEYFCDNNSTIKWFRNETSPVSLNNWMKDFHMDCESSTVISAFGMAFFFTYAIGNVVLPPFADKYGRKKILVGSLFGCLLSYIIILLLPYENWSIYAIICIFAIGGFISAGRMMVGYCFLMEFAPKKYLGWMSTIWNMHDSITVVFTILFYRYVNKDWHYTLYWCVIL